MADEQAVSLHFRNPIRPLLQKAGRMLADAVLPFRVMPKRNLLIMVVLQIAVAVYFWYHNPWKVIPTPVEIMRAFRSLWMEGLFYHFQNSIWTFLQALGWSTIFSLTLGYSSRINLMLPVGWLVSKLRFWGLAGLQFIFFVIFGVGVTLKVAILTFGMTVFLTPAVIATVQGISQAKFDEAKTLRMGGWKVMWYVVIRGTLPDVMQHIITNLAIGWTLLVVLEALLQGLGGVGGVMQRQEKYQKLDYVFAVQCGILCVGMTLDYIGGLVRLSLNPHVRLATQRRS